MKKMKTENNKMVEFEVGKQYLMNWIGDADLKTNFNVVSRTSKFVTLEDVRTGEKVRSKIYIYDGIESCKPFGSYSMAPILRADRKN